MIWIIIIYLTGYVIAYLLYRRHVKYNTGKWTVGNRFTVLCISFMSFIAVLAYIIDHIDIDTDKPAKW